MEEIFLGVGFRFPCGEMKGLERVKGPGEGGRKERPGGYFS